MSISAVNSSTPLIKHTNITTQKSLNAANSTQSKISNADGDTLSLSGKNQNNVSKTTVYAPPKVTTNSNNPTLNPQINSFLDKVANGTATIQDVKNMQSVVQKGLGATSTNSTVASNANTNPIKIFLTKVANGTASDEDLKNMQGILKQSQQQVNNASGSNRTDTALLK